MKLKSFFATALSLSLLTGTAALAQSASMQNGCAKMTPSGTVAATPSTCGSNGQTGAGAATDATTPGAPSNVPMTASKSPNPDLGKSGPAATTPGAGTMGAPGSTTNNSAQ